MANSKEELVKEMVVHYFKGDFNFLNAEINGNTVKVNLYDINDGEEYHQTLIPYIEKRGVTHTTWMYGDGDTFLIKC